MALFGVIPPFLALPQPVWRRAENASQR